MDSESVGSSVNDEGSSVGARSDSTSASRKRLEPRQYPVGMNFGKEVVERFRKDYLIEPILKTSELPHQHPHLAFERNELELRALKTIGKVDRIFDVGSGARRHAKYNLHCLCPYLQPGDAERLQLAMRNGNSVCSHKLQENCRCGGIADVLLFVHSAYYFNFQEFVDALERTTKRVAYVVGHTFEEAYGSFAYSEAKYEVNLQSQRPEIVMQVKGNAHSYVHSPLFWDGKLPTNGVIELDVELINELGSTKLWRVSHHGRLTRPTPPVSWEVAIVDRHQMGPIYVPGFDSVTRQAASVNGVVVASIDHLYGYSGYLLTNTTEGKVVIPKDLVSSVARSLHGKIRDPALFLDAIHLARNKLNSSRLPEPMRLKAQTIGAALAFNINVLNEVDVLNTVTGRYSKLWKLHKELSSLTPVKSCSISFLVALLVFSFVVIIATGLEVPYDHYLLLQFLLLIWFVTFMLCTCCICVKKRQARRTADNWSSTLYTEERVSNITGGQTTAISRVSFPAYTQLQEPLIPPQGQSYELFEDPHPPRHPSNVHNVMTLQGIASATAVPTVLPNNAEAELNAVTHRILRPVRNVDPDALQSFYDLDSRLETRLLQEVRVYGSDSMYIDWCNQTKFTVANRQKFLKAYNEKVKGDKEPTHGAFDCFVKIEKGKAMVDENDKDLRKLKARLINGPPDAVKVAVGPWTARIYQAVREVWDGTKCRVIYASGYTPDAIGAKIDAFVSDHGGWTNIVGAWSDCSAYDSTLENELLALRRKLYPMMGMPELNMRWLESTVNRGITHHGIKFDLGEKMLDSGEVVKLRRVFSGELDTNLIESIINGVSNVTGIPDDIPYLMLVCGDDNLILFDKSRYDYKIIKDLEEHLRALGVDPTFGVSEDRCDWEFCSKLLWPAIDPESGREVTVLGPKPARWVSRIGWTLKTPNALNFRAAMLQGSNDCWHIPLIREYVETGIRLSKGQRARGKEYSELAHCSKRYNMAVESLNMLLQRYQIAKPAYDELVQLIESTDKLPCVVNTSWFAKAVLRDEE